VIHLICAENRHLYEDVLAEMHRARTEFFVKGRGWTNLEVQGGLEQDAYDNDDTLYLVGFDSDGGIAVSARLLPADNGSVLGDCFPHLVTDGPAKGPGVFELSRYFAGPSLRGPKGFWLKSRMNVAVVEAVVERRGKRLVAFTDLHLLSLARYTGWQVKPIGLPAEYDEGTAVAVEIACEPADLEKMRDAVQLPERQLFAAPGWLPAGTDVHALAAATNLIVNAPAAIRQPVVETVARTWESFRPERDMNEVLARMGWRAAA
jgi:acyl-homoserine lactone synthase